MKKTRVAYGEKFWFIRTDGKVNYGLECEDLWCNDFFNCGNYFGTKEEAKSIAKKLRAVLKGADVIEMPSKEEIKQASYDCTNGYDDDQIPGFMEGVKYLKSKIVK